MFPAEHDDGQEANRRERHRKETAYGLVTLLSIGLV